MMAEQRHDRSALRWIRGELDQTLSEARHSLEDFVDGQHDSLQTCVDRLHHIHGVLDLVQVYGAAMLADEMEELAIALAQGQVKQADSAAETLMLGMVQLPGYLEKIENGGADMPLALLPLLNELRAAHNEPLISETSLFAPKLNAVIAAETVRPGSGNRELPDMVSHQRNVYLRALLNWIRGHEPNVSVGQIRDVLDALNSAAGTARLRRLLDVAEALASALLDTEQTASAPVKPLFSKLDRVFKRIIDQGEEAAMLDFPVDLLKSFLFEVVRSDSQAPAVVAVKQAADLAGNFPEPGGDAAPVAFGGPDRQMFEAVGTALAQDLRDVKDQLDLYIRSDRSQLPRLTRLAGPIQRIGDTLGMVGRGDLRTRLKRRSEELQQAERDAEPPNDDSLMGLAGDLLLVESSLAGLADGVLPATADDSAAEEGVQALSAGEMQQHVRAAIDEALVEIAKTKEAFLEFVDRGGDAGLLAGVPMRVQHVAGVMAVLGLPEAGALLRDLHPYLERLAAGEAPLPDDAQSDAVADVVIGAELYMHSVVEPGEDREKLLGIADAALHRLGLRHADASLADQNADDAIAPAATATEVGEAMAEVVPLHPENVDMTPHAPVDATATEAFEPHESPTEESAAQGTPDGIDEASEDMVPEHDGLASTVVTDDLELPAAAEQEPAAPAGELAFVDSPTQLADDAPEGVSQGLAEEVPEEVSEPVAEDTAAGAADVLPDAGPEATEVPAASQASAEASDAAADAAAPGGVADVIDPEILEVFSEEAAEELKVIQTCHPQWRADAGDRDALVTMRRSFHTLKGSGRIVGALNIGEFAWAIENLLNRVLDGTVAVSEPLLTLMDRVVDALPALVAESCTPGAPATDVSALAEHAFALAAGDSAAAEMPPPVTIADAPEDAGDAAPAVEDSADESILSDVEQQDSEFSDLDSGGVDSSLNAVFVSEVEGHLAVLERFIGYCREHADAVPFDDGVRRAMHTLRGSARTALAPEIAELAGALETLGDHMVGTARATDRAMLGLLERSHGTLAGLAAAIDDPQRMPGGWEALRDEINGVVDALVHPTPAVVEAVAPAAASAAPNPNAGVDPELLEVYLDEAKELLEVMEGGMTDWQAAPSGDNASVVELQRTLHTMKGGARLAGVVTVGDLSHALESVFQSVSEGRVEGVDRLKGLVRHATDLLAQDIEILIRGGLPDPHPAMTERLEAAAHNREWSEMPAEEAVIDAESEMVASVLTEVAAAPEAAPDMTVDVEPVLLEEPAAADPDLAGLEAPSHLAEDDQAAQAMAAEADAGFGEDSELLTDSQLMTDSELLRDSSFLVTTPLQAFETGAVGEVGDIVTAESKVVQFPVGEQFLEGEGFVPRSPLPEEEAPPATGTERVRVASDALDQMVNNAGEVSIYRARIEQQNNSFKFNLGELGQTIERLRGQLRDLEFETEAQILSRHEREGDARADFDPLELDRYSTIQQLSRALSETVEDLSNLGRSLDDLSRDTDTLLLQQARVTTDLQDSLLRTRMVKFSSRVPRLERVVRQTSHSVGKQARLEVVGGDEDMDRAILERMMGPLEHLLRNAVSHGIEGSDARLAAGKAAEGVITLHLAREGSNVVLTLADDGSGLDRDRIRSKAVERRLIEADARIDDSDLYQLILQPGFSTAEALSQVSGRGVGMDVVLTEVKQLGGTLDIDSEPGRGSSFTIHLPFTLAITDSLLVTLGDDIYAIPHSSMDGVARVPMEELKAIYAGRQSGFAYAGREYQVRYLGTMLGSQSPHLSETARWMPLLLVRSGEHRVAIQVDGLLGNRQIVVKSVGAQLSTVRWFTGGTILADGQIALILDVNSLVRHDVTQPVQPVLPEDESATRGVTVMVVDDSITVRKVTSRLLERHNMNVITAKDGVDAVTQLQEHQPDVMLLDIEMPRMDGYELARHMRSTPELSNIPIIMITSRTGDKHRNRALELGVRRYLGKPYQEAELLENIYTVLADSTL